MRLISLVFGLTLLGGCASTEIFTGSGNPYAGYKSYDPCIRCGEGWVIMPNEDLHALKAHERMKQEQEEVENAIQRRSSDST